MVRRTRSSLESENDDVESTSTALTRYRVRPESRRAKRARIQEGQRLEACCSCTRFSTCATNNCECVKANRDCGTCLCKRNCSNQPGWQNLTQGEATICQGTSEDEEDNNSAPPSDEALLTIEPPPVPLHHRTPLTVRVSDDDTPDLEPRDASYDDDEDEMPLLTQPEEEDGIPGLTYGERKLKEVYGDHLHQDDGTHLDGGIRDDAEWQARWRLIVGLPPQRYNVPNGAVGRLFVRELAAELSGVTERRWNSERFIVF